MSCDVIRPKTRTVRLSGYRLSQFISCELNVYPIVVVIEISNLISVQCDTRFPCMHACILIHHYYIHVTYANSWYCEF